VRSLRSSAASASEAKEYPRAVGLTEAGLNDSFEVVEQGVIKKNVILERPDSTRSFATASGDEKVPHRLYWLS
jgi:hypothetical protein